VVIHRRIGGAAVSQTLRLEKIAGGSSYWRQLDNFVQSIQHGTQPEVDGWQAVRVLELIENCYAISGGSRNLGGSGVGNWAGKQIGSRAEGSGGKQAAAHEART